MASGISMGAIEKWKDVFEQFVNQKQNDFLDTEGFSTEEAMAEAREMFKKNEELNQTIKNLDEHIKAIDERFPDLDIEIDKLNDDLKDLDDLIKDAVKRKKDAERKGDTVEKAKAEQDEADYRKKKKNLENDPNNRENINQYGRRENYRKQQEDALNEQKDFESIYKLRTGGKNFNAAFSAFSTMGKNSGVGKMASMLGKIPKFMGNPYVQVAQMVFQAVDKVARFAIETWTKYTTVSYENAMRTMTAVTQANVDSQKVALDSWTDALEGAYEAQSTTISNLKAITDATNKNELESLKLTNIWTNWIPIIGSLNKREEILLELQQRYQMLQLENANKYIAQTNQFTKKTDEYLKKQDTALRNYGRSVMMSVNQIDMFEERMLGVGTTFAELGRTIEDALKIQSAVNEKTGRDINYSNEDYTKTLATANIVGDENLIQFQSEMQIFNKSVGDSADIMFDMVRDVSKMGLSTKKVTASVLSNLKLANKYSFKNGTRGLIELSKWAENVRFNLSSLGNMIEKVQTGGLEGTITQAARMQVLGGNFAMGADPLAMMYEVHEDPEAFAKRMHTMIKGMGTVNKETGETTFNMYEQRTLRAYAEAAGMNYEDALTMAREENKKNVVAKQMQYTGLSKEQISAVANKAQRDAETGRWYVNTIGGGKMDVADVTTASDIEQILSNDNTEQSLQYAKETLSVEQKIKANTDFISAFLGGSTYANFVESANKTIETTRNGYVNNESEVIESVIANRDQSVKDQEKLMKSLEKIAEHYAWSLDLIETYTKTNREKFEEQIKEAQELEKEKYDEETKNLYQKAKKQSKSEIDDFLQEHAQFSLSSLLSGNGRYKWDSSESEAYYKSLLAKHNEMFEQQHSKTQWALDNNRTYKSNYNLDVLMEDGVVSSKNKPMSVVATDVVPIHDGKVKLAKTDPQDSAIFAKSGGPFDTLFNDIFGKINEVYKDVSGRREMENKTVSNASQTLNNIYNNENNHVSKSNGTVSNVVNEGNDGRTYRTTTISELVKVLNEGNVSNTSMSNTSVSKVNEHSTVNDMTNDFSQILNKILNDNKTYNTEYSTILNDILTDTRNYDSTSNRYISSSERKTYEVVDNVSDNRTYSTAPYTTIVGDTSNIENVGGSKSYDNRVSNVVNSGDTSNIENVGSSNSYDNRVSNVLKSSDTSYGITKNVSERNETNVLNGGDISNISPLSNVYENNINSVLNRLFNSDKTLNDYGDIYHGGNNVRNDETITSALSNVFNDSFEKNTHESNVVNEGFKPSNDKGREITERILNKVDGKDDRNYVEKTLSNVYESHNAPEPVFSDRGDVFSKASDKSSVIYEKGFSSQNDTNTNIMNNGQYNVNINGNIKLESNGKTFDISKELETNPFLIRQITQLISDNISKSLNGGKSENAGIMNLSSFRG